MTRLLALVVLGIAVVSILAEAKSKRIHVIAQVKQVTFIDNSADPQPDNRRITSVELHDENGTKVGAGEGSCAIVSIPDSPVETLIQCLLTVAFAEGQLFFGGVTSLPEVGVVTHFDILGGTNDFRQARGDVTIVVTTPEFMDVTFDLEIDSERKHGEFPAP
jgi:hypothetical protein